METVSFTKHNLKDFIYSDQYRNLKNIPISKHRAISQINNPRADEEDVLLVAQFDENKTMGYLGVLPDYIYNGESKEKIGWLTCFWVDDAYKSQNVAANLFRRVIRAYSQKIFITNIVPWLDPVYQKTKLFLPTKQKSGFRGYLRSNLSEILPPKKITFKKLTGLLKLIDGGLNIIFSIRFLFYQPYKLPDLSYEYVTDFNEIQDEFIAKNNKNNWSQRGKEDLNWIVKFPWMIEGATRDYNCSKYYFSALSKRFFYQIVIFKDKKGSTVGVLFLNIRNNNITIPYLYCDKSIIESISKFLINKMQELKLNMLTTFNEELSTSLKRFKKRFLFTKDIKKLYFVSKKFDFIEDLNFQDGDGDCAFY